MYTSKLLPKSRIYTYHFLDRMKRFHCPISGICELDVTDTLHRIEELRAQGRKVGLIAYLTKATAKTIEAHPRLNNRLFHGLLWKREVSYDHITCGILAERQNAKGENILIPITVRNVHQKSIEEIHALIKEHKASPLEELETYKQVARLDKIPRWLIPLIHFLFRTHPRYSAEKFSTYGLSSIIRHDGPMLSGNAPSNQTTFFPFNLTDQVVAHNGEPTIRRILRVGVAVDHFLLDGMDLQRAIATFQKYVEDPSTLLE